MLFISLALLAGASTLAAAAPPPAEPLVPQNSVMAEPAPPSLERQALARRYVSLTLPPDKFIAGMRFSTSRMVVALRTASGDASDGPDFDSFMERFMALLETKLRDRVPNIMEAYSQAYAREFSADELQQMIAFAQSPAGQHYLAKQFDLASDPAVQLQEQGLQADVPGILHQLEKEQCAARTARRIAAGDKKARCPLADKPDVAAG